MAKKRSTAKAGQARAAKRSAGRSRERTPSVGELQKQIRGVDRQLVKLINQRAQLACQLMKGCQTQGAASLMLDSTQQVAEAVAANKGPLPDRTVEAVLRELASGCRALVRDVKVAFLGPPYSYCHLAAIRHFGRSVQFMPVGTIAAVFEEVNRGHSEFGIVPIENSTDGRIADTLEMFPRLPVKVCGEVQLAIHHTLLGKCHRTEVKEVYSRPQALSQCRNWLAKHLPAARMIEVTSTSTAAQLAREKPGAAAIASLEAGVQYGLDVLAERIEDNPHNVTRFAVIGEHSSPRTGDDRTAMMFQTEHRFGALCDALAVFKRNRINLTWIESFPVPGTERAYLFFVEMEGHETDARIRRAVAALSNKTLRLEILGSCPAAAPKE
ncbi:MAG TPA: prephenate dehydratase [Planctomycetaceae bacterium]|nr:prephenate dehydratase [Planctomycetaceae bacterium]